MSTVLCLIENIRPQYAQCVWGDKMLLVMVSKTLLLKIVRAKNWLTQNLISQTRFRFWTVELIEFCGLNGDGWWKELYWIMDTLWILVD